jgi:lathosterol oxidase
MPSDESGDKNTTGNIWNHKGPVIFSPLFDWPPRPQDAFLALTKRWVTLTRNVLFLLMAVCVYNFFLPDMADMSTLSFQWVVTVFVRNTLLITLVAGGLHLFLFTFRGQGNKLKFDRREQLEKAKKFSFNNQVHDNILWSIASGVTVWSTYEILYFWGVANNVIPTLGFTANPIAFFSWLLILPVIMSAHFYLIHRLLHWPPLFKRVHKLHHNNVHIGPWSGMSMHPVEHIIYISSVLIHFVIASHPVIVFLHLYTRCLAPAFSHAGFEKLLIKDKAITEGADFHHQLHHKYFECNYGNVDMPWDRWFGSVHDGSEEATQAVTARRRKRRKTMRN